MPLNKENQLEKISTKLEIDMLFVPNRISTTYYIILFIVLSLQLGGIHLLISLYFISLCFSCQSVALSHSGVSFMMPSLFLFVVFCFHLPLF